MGLVEQYPSFLKHDDFTVIACICCVGTLIAIAMCLPPFIPPHTRTVTSLKRGRSLPAVPLLQKHPEHAIYPFDNYLQLVVGAYPLMAVHKHGPLTEKHVLVFSRVSPSSLDRLMQSPEK